MKKLWGVLRDRKLWALLGFGFFLSFIFPFVSSPFLRVFRNVYGSLIFWGAGLLLTALLFLMDGASMAVYWVSLVVLIGVFGEFEERGHGHFWAGMLSISLATLTSWKIPSLLELAGLSRPEESLQTSLKTLVHQIEVDPNHKGWLAAFGLTTETLLSLLPSVLGILFLVCLASALMFDRRTATSFGLKFERIVGTPRLLDFRIPDSLIWCLLFSFLFSFLRVGSPVLTVVAVNLLQFLLGLYFFQGLAVMETALLIFRVGPFLRVVLYIFIVGQLFFLLSLVGLADYWVEFRRRLRLWKIKQQRQPKE